MYAVVRRYRFDPTTARRLIGGLGMPLCTSSAELPASKPTIGWIPVKVEGASARVFRDKAGVEESIRIAANFVEQHLASLLGKPEIIQGEVHARADRSW